MYVLYVVATLGGPHMSAYTNPREHDYVILHTYLIIAKSKWQQAQQNYYFVLLDHDILQLREDTHHHTRT